MPERRRLVFAGTPEFAVPSLAALLASSRFMINAHFLGDVVGGAAVAVLTTLALRAALAERGWLFERRPARGIGLGPAARALGQDVRGLIAGR